MPPRPRRSLPHISQTRSRGEEKQRKAANNHVGVWLFKNGVVKLVDPKLGAAGKGKRKALLHVPSGQVVSSYTSLERMLAALGWERYYDGDGDTLQFHKRSSVDLIRLPKDFARFGSVHMYNLVVKNRDAFCVIDA